jgi:hypothetical protein
MSREIKCKKVEFHAEIFTTVLKGFAIPSSVFSALEKVLDVMVNGVLTVTSEKASAEQQYWIMLTRYEYQPLLNRVQPIVRVIAFQVNSKTSDYVINKTRYSEVNFTLSFSQYQCDFNSKIYKSVSASYDQELIEKGKKLSTLRTTDIPVAV